MLCGLRCSPGVRLLGLHAAAAAASTRAAAATRAVAREAREAPPRAVQGRRRGAAVEAGDSRPERLEQPAVDGPQVGLLGDHGLQPPPARIGGLRLWLQARAEGWVLQRLRGEWRMGLSEGRSQNCTPAQIDCTSLPIVTPLMSWQYKRTLGSVLLSVTERHVYVGDGRPVPDHDGLVSRRR